MLYTVMNTYHHMHDFLHSHNTPVRWVWSPFLEIWREVDKLDMMTLLRWELQVYLDWEPKHLTMFKETAHGSILLGQVFAQNVDDGGWLFASCILSSSDEAAAHGVCISCPLSLDIFHGTLLFPVFWIIPPKTYPARRTLHWQKLLKFFPFLLFLNQ